MLSLYPSDEDAAFLDTYLADFQKLKRILFSKLYGHLRPKNLSKFFSMCKSICARRRVRLIKVFAGYSSQIDAINYLDRRKRMSSHEAAALVIARRGQSKMEGLNISNLNSAPRGQEILSQSQERLAGPAIRILKKYSKKLDFRSIKASYLQFNPEKRRRPELNLPRSHVFSPSTCFRDSA